MSLELMNSLSCNYLNSNLSLLLSGKPVLVCPWELFSVNKCNYLMGNWERNPMMDYLALNSYYENLLHISFYCIAIVVEFALSGLVYFPVYGTLFQGNKDGRMNKES